MSEEQTFTMTSKVLDLVVTEAIAKYTSALAEAADEPLSIEETVEGAKLAAAVVKNMDYTTAIAKAEAYSKQSLEQCIKDFEKLTGMSVSVSMGVTLN